MTKKISILELKLMLANANVRAVCDNDFIVRSNARDEARKLRSRINRRERDEAMRDLGLTKVRGNLGGVYWK